jgi:hypothetical protein
MRAVIEKCADENECFQIYCRNHVAYSPSRWSTDDILFEIHHFGDYVTLRITRVLIYLSRTYVLIKWGQKVFVFQFIK